MTQKRIQDTVKDIALVSALILASHMLGRRRKIIKLDYPHFMPDIRQWIKITIDIYIYYPTVGNKNSINVIVED